ncbi:MAG: acetyl-CoA carboxylase biotin carboxyl carrier protein subunit [Bacteroidia bacterium]|nr:MAG: acetyl-CoA carboxylase biotin carboxyl carrier protein subunit [Bacteroidia bacterium]
MDLSYIKKIIKLVEHSGVDEIEIEEEGKKIRVAKNRNSTGGYAQPMMQMPVYQPVQAPAPQTTAPSVPAPQTEEKPKSAEKTYHEIRSPIVGTFYRAPSPDAEPYVEVGQAVKAGDVLCIVEAMKLMNEIESDIAGTVVKIAVDNARPVEYNQTLFYIDPA